MKELLDDLERGLTDLVLLGLATAGPDMVARMHGLAKKCEDTGLHTGAELFAELGRAIAERNHTLEKTDHRAVQAICRAQHYITLCRTRMTEEDIRDRWQQGGTT